MWKFYKIKKHVSNPPTPLRDRSIFMGIRGREYCNGATSYFSPSFGRGHWLFWRLSIRGHRLFQCSFSTGLKIIFEYSHTGPWIIIDYSGIRDQWLFFCLFPELLRDQRFFSRFFPDFAIFPIFSRFSYMANANFSRLFSISSISGTGPCIILAKNLWRNLRGHSKNLSSGIRGRRFFMMVFSTGPWQIFDQPDTGPQTFIDGFFNGAAIKFCTVNSSFPGPVFP